MITIDLNGQEIRIASNTSVHALLADYGHLAVPMAVALNNQLIPAALMKERFLKEGDRLDLIIPMQGG